MEFALVLPILLLLIFGIVDAGRLIFTYNTVCERSPRRCARGDRQPVHGWDGHV